MELRLTIFFALSCLVMAGNAALLWYLWRMFHRAADLARENRVASTQVVTTLGQSLRLAEELTDRLARASAAARASVEVFDDGLRRVDNVARYGLARADFNVDRVSERLRSGTSRLTGRMREPLYRTAAAIHGVRAALEYVSRWRGRTPGTLERARHAAGRLDTAATIVQAVTAVGELFSRRARESRLREEIRS